MTDYRIGTLDLELVCEGLLFPEGPVAMRDGSVILVEIAGQRVSRIAPDGVRTTIAELPGGPNGAAIGPDGALYVCNNGGMAFAELPGGGLAPTGAAPDHRGGSIDRIDLTTGEVVTLYRTCDGQPLNSPNDIVFGADGGFWFTDLGRTLPLGHDHGHVYHALPDGSRIVHVRGGMTSPNGIGLSPDGTRLYVAETITSRVWVHEVTGPGRIAAPANLWVPGEVLGPLPGYQLLDSLAVAADGSVCVATLINGGITVFAPDGSVATHYAIPDFATTNICFGGDDMCTAWITASSMGRLYRTRWPVPGLALAFDL